MNKSFHIIVLFEYLNNLYRITGSLLICNQQEHTHISVLILEVTQKMVASDVFPPGTGQHRQDNTVFQTEKSFLFSHLAKVYPHAYRHTHLFFK